MLLVFDIGNTSIAFGAFDGEALLFSSKILTEDPQPEAALKTAVTAALSGCAKRAADVDAVIISSVVPALTDIVAGTAKALTGCDALIVGEACHGIFHTDILPVREIGADLIAASVAAAKKYPLPCVVADLGTATKFIVLDGDGAFLGCTIAPGVLLSARALSKGAALLPEFALSVPPRVIGTETVACMQSGLVYGTAAMLDGMAERICKELGSGKVTLVATGGYSRQIVSCCTRPFLLDETLLLDGLRFIYEDTKH